jgi:hypothetical protein
MSGFWLELVFILVEVDLVATKRECFSGSTERYDVHAENPRVKVAGSVNILNSQNKVIDSVNLQRVLS